MVVHPCVITPELKYFISGAYGACCDACCEVSDAVCTPPGPERFRGESPRGAGAAAGHRTVLKLFKQRHTCMMSRLHNWCHVPDYIEEETSIGEVGLGPGLEMGSLGR